MSVLNDQPFSGSRSKGGVLKKIRKLQREEEKKYEKLRHEFDNNVQHNDLTNKVITREYSYLELDDIFKNTSFSSTRKPPLENKIVSETPNFKSKFNSYEPNYNKTESYESDLRSFDSKFNNHDASTSWIEKKNIELDKQKFSYDKKELEILRKKLLDEKEKIIFEKHKLKIEKNEFQIEKNEFQIEKENWRIYQKEYNRTKDVPSNSFKREYSSDGLFKSRFGQTSNDLYDDHKTEEYDHSFGSDENLDEILQTIELNTKKIQEELGDVLVSLYDY